MSLSHFTFSGTTYEQGLAHGEALKESIIKNIEIYVIRFENEAGISKNELLENSGIYLNILREQSPEYINGMNGIAESSNLELLEIAMLNLRYELLYHALGKKLQSDAAPLQFYQKPQRITIYSWGRIGTGFQMLNVCLPPALIPTVFSAWLLQRQEFSAESRG